MADQHNFPSWDALYKSTPVEEMPWFSRGLDHDLAAELARRKITQGVFLGIGTGPGTQAIALAKLGFTVTGSDLSEAAIHRAQGLQSPVTFVTDDITHTTLRGSFNYIFDRGCFHVLDPKDRATYVHTVRQLLAAGGLLFLKCFSLRETKVTEGPYRFTPAELRTLFEPHFRVESIKESEFRGTLTPNPKALFAVMRKK